MEKIVLTFLQKEIRLMFWGLYSKCWVQQCSAKVCFPMFTLVVVTISCFEVDDPSCIALFDSTGYVVTSCVTTELMQCCLFLADAKNDFKGIEHEL